MRIAIKTQLLIFLLFTAAQAGAVHFAVIGDFGVDNSAELSVATLIKSWNPEFIVTTGDNSCTSYPIDNNVGKYFAEYIGNYQGSHGQGSPVNRFFPSLGNHDYTEGGGLAAYLAYFTLPGDAVPTSGTSGNERYYDFVQGPVHFFVLNSYPLEPDGMAIDSVQGEWLEAQLAASTAPWKIVILHYAPFSSGTAHGSQPIMQWPYEVWGADAVLAGHDHIYERILRDDNGDGVVCPYFVCGVGGRPLHSFPSTGFVLGSQVRYNADYGAILVDATDSRLTFQFYSVAGGGTRIDDYTICRCVGTTGNVDGDPGDVVDVSDMTAMIGFLFLGQWIPECRPEIDADQSGVVDISDLQMLIDYLFLAGALPACS